MYIRRLIPLLTLLSWAAGVSSDEDECGLYLAISSTSTSEALTWGVYAGRSYSKDTQIGFPDVAVNIFHLKANAQFETEDEEDEAEYDYLNRVVDYLEGLIWVPDSSGGKFELEEGRTVTGIPGTGVLGGFNVRLTNANWNVSAAYRRPLMGEEPGVNHPGRGAYSPFYNVVLRSLNDIVAGMEIFLDYGENWEDEEKKEELSKEEHLKVDETVDKMIAFFEKHEGELDDESKLQIYNFLIKDVMHAAVGPAKARKVSAILPASPDDLHKVREAGGSLVYSAPTVYRKPEWLAEHGRCMDNIRPDTSTVPHAGRGAFANRKIKEGGLVSPVPLVQIPDKIIFDMHDVGITDEGDFVRASDEVVDQQMIINYCFGHPESSMVFFPAGSVAAFINHSNEPNAKLVWSNHPSHQKYWYNLHPEQLVDEENMYVGLVMEIVATRDIEEGEEVFIDYGPEWAAAWEEHLNEWTALYEKGELAQTWPVSAIDLNDEYKDKPFKTEEDLEVSPYPDSIEFMGFLMVEETDNEGTLEDPKKWGQPEDGTAFEADNLFPLVVVDVVTGGVDSPEPFYYTVRWENNVGEPTFVSGVPHSALVFVEAPGASDNFVEGAFRHYIGIPDDVFPQGPWRNLEF